MELLTIFGPFVFTSDLLLLLRCEIVRDVERLPNLFRRFTLDHIGNSLAANVKKRLDVEIIGGLR